MPAGAVVAALGLVDQAGVADVLAIEPLPATPTAAPSLRVATHHVIREGTVDVDYVVIVAPLASVRDGLVVGGKIGDGEALGAAAHGVLQVEVRRVREGLDLASLKGAGLLADDRAVRTDPRNVLPLR